MSNNLGKLKFPVMSFKLKLIISYITLILLPTMIGGVLLYKEALNSLNNRTYDMVHQMIVQQKSDINRKLDTIQKVTRDIANNILLMKFFAASYYDNDELISTLNITIRPLISWMIMENNYLNGLKFFTYNKNIPETEIFLCADEYQSEDWFINARNNSTNFQHYWEPYHTYRSYKYSSVRYEEGNYSLFFVMSPYGSEEKTYIEAQIPGNYVFDMLNNVPIVKNGYMIVTDLDGNIIFSENPKLDSQIVSTTLFKETVKKGNGTIHLTAEEIRYVVTIDKIDRLSSYLVSIIPETDISGPFNRIKYTSLLLLCFIIIVIILISYFIAWVLLKRINKMTKAIHKIQNGDLNIHIPVDGSDEISTLAKDINIMSDEINYLVNKVMKAEIVQKEATIAALQAQINPHFLFNTIETIKMMAEINRQEEISSSLTALGNVMWYNIQSDTETIELGTELEFIMDYEKIQNKLLNNCLKITYCVDSRLFEIKIPKLIIQPLIENSITHGLRNKYEILEIILMASMCEQELCITVQDNGRGIDPERLSYINEMLQHRLTGKILSMSGHGIALTNIQDRLILKYGSPYGIRIESCENKGVTVKVTVPIIH